MVPGKYLDGPGLEELYLRDKSHEDLTDPKNLKTLLDYILNKNTRELTNSDLEIIDFCNEHLYPDECIDPDKIQFLEDKYNLIEREQANRHYICRCKKLAARFAVLLFGGVFLFCGTESEAGIFDWVRSLFVEEDGEQLSITTPNATLESIEIKEGHLPKKMPEGYVFADSLTDSSRSDTTYIYNFHTPEDEIITIQIREFYDEATLFNVEKEIIASSADKETSKNTTYYHIKNHDENSIVWTDDLKLYKISGLCSYKELAKILSYYQEK